MPMPLSLMETKTLFLFSVVSILITESEWENLIALSSRLYSTCWIFPISPFTKSCSPVSTSSMAMCFCWQVPSKEAAVLRMMELMSKSVFSSTIPLVFRLFRVSRLLVSLVRRSVSFRTIFRYFSCSSGGMVPSSMASR